MENHKEENVPAIKLLVRDRVSVVFGAWRLDYLLNSFVQNDKDKENFKKIITAMKASKAGKTMGVFSKDPFPGEFCEGWQAALKAESFEKLDVGAAFAFVMAPKEDSEIVTIKKACVVSIDVFSKYLKDHIMEVIDADKVSGLILHEKDGLI